MKLKWMTIGVVLAGVLSSQALPVLWDFNETSGGANDGTVADFVELGVTEDLTGATVSQITASTNAAMTDGTISLSYLSGMAQSATSYLKSNVVLADYLYLQDGANGAPVEFRISGLASVLLANTTYSLYLIGAGDNTDQGSQFTFNTVTKSTISAATAPEAVAKFSFVTGAVAPDTLDFTWERIGSNTWGGFNGLAIAAVPEPATIALFGISSVFIFLARRNFRKGDDADPSDVTPI